VKIDLRDMGSLIPTPDGRAAVPERFIATTSPDSLGGLEVRMRIEITRPFRARCTELTVLGSSHEVVTAEALRRVSLGRLVKEAVAETASHFEFRGTASDGTSKFVMFSDGGEEIYAATLASVGRGAALSDSDLREIADLYRAAIASGSRSPTRDVGERKHVARSTAARWVAQTRSKGFLGPSIRGRGGEGQEGTTSG
jgi:hypothetical protein